MSPAMRDRGLKGRFNARPKGRRARLPLQIIRSKREGTSRTEEWSQDELRIKIVESTNSSTH